MFPPCSVVQVSKQPPSDVFGSGAMCACLFQAQLFYRTSLRGCLQILICVSLLQNLLLLPGSGVAKPFSTEQVNSLSQAAA